MLPLWLSSWYQHQQVQSQEPFNDQYEAADGEGDWVEVITPSIKRRQPIKNDKHNEVPIPESIESSSSASTSAVMDPVVKGLSRQERRAKARFAVKDKKKQARSAAMVLNRNRVKGALASSTCLSSSLLTIDH